MNKRTLIINVLAFTSYAIFNYKMLLNFRIINIKSSVESFTEKEIIKLLRLLEICMKNVLRLKN